MHQVDGVGLGSAMAFSSPAHLVSSISGARGEKKPKYYACSASSDWQEQALHHKAATALKGHALHLNLVPSLIRDAEYVDYPVGLMRSAAAYEALSCSVRHPGL